MTNLAEDLRQAADAVALLGSSSADLAALPDADVLTGQTRIASARRLLDTYSVWMAATIAERSRPELGHSGLAAQQGFLSPEALIQKWTGSSKGDAYKLVAVGTMMADAEAAEKRVEAALSSPDRDAAEVAGFEAKVPWQAPIARAVTAGTLSVDAAESIRAGLGQIDAAVTAERLGAALEALLVEAASLNADEVFKRARRMRDSLDEAGIAAREKQAYDDRYLKVYRLNNGNVRLNGLFSPEDGEFVLSTFDSITGPRRGGVRFVDKERASWAKKMQDDPRTNEQIAADSLVQLLKIAGEADPGRVFGGRRPAVRVIVTEKALNGGQAGQADQAGQTDQAGQADQTGQTDQAEKVSEHGSAETAAHGLIDGNPVPISQETIDRLLCDTGTRGIKFDDNGLIVNVGREARLFTEKQRAAMAVRDGGCLWIDCDRSPAWNEAHHINEWLKDNGYTDLADGVLLCHPHHLLLHNQHWTIIRTGTQYWLRPPVEVDLEQTLVALPSKRAGL
ncbi:DUF222 domain-containing protein [Cryobacterium sinapicolor]|uniref:DUF222 domain-containing protein n=1 Tax=Cryobacterium sinapicolor TaxID=1259236 RepID=A0ABY2JFH5_9MICO|nr:MULTISPECIES: DUF222 domain-containing protein [Cryobacterium]TFC88004.1 DUF222 domain-containing protein [Cryobacterium sp. TMT3-29-2]TFD04738.1 DUF222 domain-containing protein [Cryobacterium sinapicolor]